MATITVKMSNGTTITFNSVEDYMKASKSGFTTPSNEGVVSQKPTNPKGKPSNSKTVSKSNSKPTTSPSKKDSGKKSTKKATTTPKGSKKSGKGNTTNKVVKRRTAKQLEAYHAYCDAFWADERKKARYSQMSAEKRKAFNKAKLVELNAKVKALGL